MIVYKITNKINGKIYIGQTRCRLSKRWYEHRYTAKSTVIHLAIRKYGEQNFLIEEIDAADCLEDLVVLEQFWIDFYNSKTPNGYNLLNAGMAPVLDLKTKQLLKEKCANVWTGKRHTEETKAKMSTSARGRPKSETARANMRKPKTEKAKNAMRRPKSEQGRANIKKARQAQAKRIEDQNGVQYASIREASQILNINQSCINEVLQGRQKKTKGYSFKLSS